MAVSTFEIERKREVASKAVLRARELGHDVLLSCSIRVGDVSPLRFFTGARDSDRFYWERALDGVQMAGVGSGYVLALEGEGRFRQASTALDRLAKGAVVDPVGPGPLAFVGFAFDASGDEEDIWTDYPDGLMVIPERLLYRKSGQSWLAVTRLVKPDSDPEDVALEMETALSLENGAPSSPIGDGPGDAPDESALLHSSHGSLKLLRRTELPEYGEWADMVRESVDDIDRERYEKIVLARRFDLEFDGAIDPTEVLERLRAQYPEALVFAFGRGEHCFLGASPEPLARVEQGAVHVSCLAGTALRSADEKEDRLNAETLKERAKDRAEHDFVVRFATEQLGELCNDLQIPDHPDVLSLRNVHHLMTPIDGRLKEGSSILDVAAVLHPTPAVAGYPPTMAIESIARREQSKRGWYAGAVGWIDLHGQGELAVGIRSGLLEGNSAHLFAGGGIVAGSDPQMEWEETVAKLQPMLGALGLG